MRLEDVVERACERVPGLLRGALVLLPEGFLLAGVGGESALDLEPLIRSASRCLAERKSPALRGRPIQPFAEYLFVTDDQLIVIQGGRRDPRLALAVVCTREHNVGFALAASRLAISDVETGVDLAAWGL